MLKKYYLPLAVLTVLGLTSVASAAQKTKNGAACPPPQPAAVCYPDDCVQCPRCLGPENFAANPPVCPKTCGGDWMFTAAAFYWNAHQDGMEFAIDNDVTNPLVPPSTPTQLNQLAEAEYKTPHSRKRIGFKLGLGYCSPCDGWDFGVVWTWFHGRAHADIDADIDSNHTLLPLWSQFVSSSGSVQFATAAEDHWKLKLNLVDVELGRNYWVSKYLAIRPFVGVRYASLKQHTEIEYIGGSWSATNLTTPTQPAFKGIVDLQNNYRGPGLRAGLNSEWNFGCGWAIYGNAAASIIYGRFGVDHDEFIRLATNPHSITNILDTEESFRASRAIFDLGLGIQWSTMFCSCQYGFTAMFGWEQHLFFDQNQMWRVNRVGTTAASGTNPVDFTVNPPVLNLSGDNILQQRRGSLDAQGWTLTFRFEF